MKSLQISGKKTEDLSKQQQRFNRLIKKIEQLRRSIEETGKLLDHKIQFYSQQIHPLEQQFAAQDKIIARLLYSFYKEKKFGTNQKEVLRNMISDRVQSATMLAGVDAEMEDIFRDIEGMTFEEAQKEEAEMMKEEMEDAFRSFGIDIDFTKIKPGMSEEEIMAEMQQQVFGDAAADQEKKTTRKKTKKQLEKEEKQKQAEALRQKNIGTIYKQLAKVFHPDLEPDQELKKGKEELMKQLTVAYENNDLHTLLRLELEWLQKEEHNVSQMADEKLDIYNTMLQKQVKELEDEYYATLYHPRYDALRYFTPSPAQITKVDMERELARIKYLMQDQIEFIEMLKGPEKEALKELKTLIKEYLPY